MPPADIGMVPTLHTLMSKTFVNVCNVEIDNIVCVAGDVATGSPHRSLKQLIGKTGSKVLVRLIDCCMLSCMCAHR